MQTKEYWFVFSASRCIHIFTDLQQSTTQLLRAVRFRPKSFLQCWANLNVRKFLKRCIPQPTVCILYSLLTKAIHMGSVPGTIAFSCQSATSILDATLLWYAVFIDKIDFDCLFCTLSWLSAGIFRVNVLLASFLLLLYSLLLSPLHVLLFRAFTQ